MNTPAWHSSSFDKTTGADLRKFHNTWYVPNNAVLVIVGNMEPQTVLAQVKTVFAGSRSTTARAPEFNFERDAGHAEARHRSTYGLTAITFRFPGADNPDLQPRKFCPTC